MYWICRESPSSLTFYTLTAKFWVDLFLNLSLTSFRLHYKCRPAPLWFRRSRIQLQIISIQLNMWTICFLKKKTSLNLPLSV